MSENRFDSQNVFVLYVFFSRLEMCRDAIGFRLLIRKEMKLESDQSDRVRRLHWRAEILLSLFSKICLALKICLLY